MVFLLRVRLLGIPLSLIARVMRVQGSCTINNQAITVRWDCEISLSEPYPQHKALSLTMRFISR